MELLFADVFSNIGRTIMNILAVAGGFLIGNVLMLIVCRLLAKFAFKARLPYWLEGSLRIVGGVAVAILVAYFVFGDGNWGFGGSGGGRPGGPGGTSAQQQGENKEEPQDKPKEEPKPKIEPKPHDTTIKVTIMRGSSFPKTFRFDGSESPVDLDTAKNVLRKKADESGGKLKSVTFVLYDNSTAAKGTIVEELEKFVSTTLGLDITISNIPESLP